MQQEGSEAAFAEAERDDRPLRTDAARNRARIVAAATAVFAEQGFEASYHEIARRAGVGVGTVYRRFPAREELVRDLFEAKFGELVATAERAATFEDALAGLVWFIEQTIQRQAHDRGLREVMRDAISPDEQNQLGRQRLGATLEQLVEQAQAQGTLRSDVGVSDFALQMLLMSHMAGPGRPDMWRRHLAIVLQGLASSPQQELLPLEPPSDDFLATLY